MEILIELIVWIFKGLFGEQEKPADVPPTRGPTPRQQRTRGPYIYGDEGAPKTLEEILEEARRKAQQRGGGSGGGPSNQVRPAAKRPPAVRPTRRIVSEAPVAPSGPPAANPFAPLTGMAGTRLIPLAESEEARPPDTFDWATKRQASAPQKKAGASKQPALAMEESPSQSTLPAAREAIVARPTVATVRTIAAPVRASGASTFEIVNAIRAASPSQKAAVARQAGVMYEIFGPPRALRPHRVGQRLL